jgi:dTDP-4-amino-4,6-dideoxygalactose transaminase
MNRHTRLDLSSIPFIDLAAQRKRLGRAIDDAIARVLGHGQFVLGPEVFALEADLAAFCGARHVVTCANGTDALLLVLMAHRIGPGDAVLCPSFTFCATAEVVLLAGATPVLVDVEEASFNIDPASVARGIAAAKRAGLRPRAVIPVDLFGLPADHDSVNAVAKGEGLVVLDDAAQAFGASYKERRIGTLSDATAVSFYPAKPFGCYGDGGAILTSDAELATTLRSLRMHGQGKHQYDNVRVGMNSRLDTMQAAILIEKLKIFAEEIAARNRIAARYAAGLGDIVNVPVVAAGSTSVWAQYTIRVGDDRRDRLAADLKAQGVPTAVYYPTPLHLQAAYRQYPVAANGLPVSEALAGEVLSLPMHPYLDEAVQDRIIEAVRRALRPGSARMLGESTGAAG